MENATPNIKPEHIPVTVKEAVMFCTYEHSQMTLDVCLVCKLHLMECCIECRAGTGSTTASSGCVVVRGSCNHIFHEHCITSWVQRRVECPACMKEWTPVGYVDCK
uniref:Uncharacterized protein TCIL3000_5_4210 n=1 Tax=Trypanosoma congolense (strain IL3000) TaxID=1068625 RepID=G0UM12_TRYCI|nr:unnamed protein product [Trypanosoma congolense IL3000]